MSRYEGNLIVKFADDTTEAGLISGNDDSVCSKGERLVGCSQSNRDDHSFQKTQIEQTPLSVSSCPVERVEDLQGPELVQEHLRDHKAGPSETTLPEETETGVSPPASSGLYTEAWWRLTAHQRDVPAAGCQTRKHFRG